MTLSVQGPGGADARTQLGAVTTNRPGLLNIDFSGSVTSGDMPLSVQFRAINLTGRALTGTFDFGDGTTGSVSAGNGRVTHVYDRPGTFTVTLMGSDANDADIEQKVGYITVHPTLGVRK